jgi:hypothetical protein
MSSCQDSAKANTETIMARRQIETGVRNVQEDDYKGRRIEVITGYEIRSNKWPIHVFVGKTDKSMRKIDRQWLADSQNEAFDAGFRIGETAIDEGWA